MIVIDPVDPNRNVASVLSPPNFVRFVAAAKAFLARPSGEFFFPQHEVDVNKLERLLLERETKMLAVEFARPNVLPDILYPQLRKTAQRLAKVMKENEFAPMGYEVFSDGRSYIILELEVWKLPHGRKLVGPPVFSRVHTRQFVGKYRGKGRVWTEGDKYVAEIKREFTTADSKIMEFLGDDVDVLKEKGIASYIAESVCKGFRVLDEGGIIRRAKKDNEFAWFLWEYLHREFY